MAPDGVAVVALVVGLVHVTVEAWRRVRPRAGRRALRVERAGPALAPWLRLLRLLPRSEPRARGARGTSAPREGPGPGGKQVVAAFAALLLSSLRCDG